MTSIDNVSDERLRMFIECALPYRTLEVQISRGDERRLARHIAAVNRDLPEDPMDPTNDSDLATAFAGAALRGMDANDEDDGVWTDLDGIARALPRPTRAPWRKRLRYSWQAARQTWRAS